MVELEDWLADHNVAGVVAAGNPEAEGIWTESLGDAAACFLLRLDLFEFSFDSASSTGDLQVEEASHQ